jgi:hypothetical protein
MHVHGLELLTIESKAGSWFAGNACWGSQAVHFEPDRSRVIELRVARLAVAERHDSIEHRVRHLVAIIPAFT